MSTPPLPAIGFIGLGTMGEPMALNLVKSGLALCVWNRSTAKLGILREAGARIASDPAEVFTRCEIVMLMVSDGTAIDTVLARSTPAFAERVRGHIIVNMATVSLAYSKRLAADISGVGGAYVEAPVSGSRKPAEAAQLVAMVAGESAVVDVVKPLLRPMCRSLVDCGAVPGALTMKFAVNILMLATLTGLAEAVNFANAQGLDMDTFFTVVNVGPMASDASRAKVTKLQTGDSSVQAILAGVMEMNQLIVAAARGAGVATPLSETCLALYAEANALGFGAADVISVIHAFEQRTAGQNQRS